MNLVQLNNNQRAFFSLIKAGLWEKETYLAQFEPIDFREVFRLAEEQSVVGLIAAGFEFARDIKIPQNISLELAGQALQLEQRNLAMNQFIADIVDKMRKAGIYTLLVKGQGVARCYEKPLWRTCGDVDFLLSDDNYAKAKEYLLSVATNIEKEGTYSRHLALTVDQWAVELHGTLRCSFSSRVDRYLDVIQRETFFDGKVRPWMNGNTHVFMMSVENDIIYIFAHFLKHFYLEGIGLRQICDWCRMLWTYRDKMDIKQIERMIGGMKLMSEWKAFGAFAVEYLGMPVEAMPLYSHDTKWKQKAVGVCSFIMEVGNFGHNRDSSYYTKPFIVRKTMSFMRRCGDVIRHAKLFPLDSLRFFFCITKNGIKAAAKGK